MQPHVTTSVPPSRRSGRAASCRERGSSMVEYVGLGAITATLVSGIAAAVDSSVGDRLAAAIVRRLLAAIAGFE